MEHWVGTKNLHFCSGCNVPTLFLNIPKRSLVCWEHGNLPNTLLTTVNNNSLSGILYNLTTPPPIERASPRYPPHRETLSSSVGVLGNAEQLRWVYWKMLSSSVGVHGNAELLSGCTGKC